MFDKKEKPLRFMPSLDLLLGLSQK